jgi:hypothetical protein
VDGFSSLPFIYIYKGFCSIACGARWICGSLVESFVGKLSLHQLLFAWSEPKLSSSPTVSLSLSLSLVFGASGISGVFSKYLTVEVVGLQLQSSFHSPTPNQFASIIIYIQMSHQHYRTGFCAPGSVTASKKICLSIEPRGFPKMFTPREKGSTSVLSIGWCPMFQFFFFL